MVQATTNITNLKALLILIGIILFLSIIAFLINILIIKFSKQKHWKYIYYKYYNDTYKLLQIIREKQIIAIEGIYQIKKSFLKELKNYKKALKKLYKNEYRDKRYRI